MNHRPIDHRELRATTTVGALMGRILVSAQTHLPIAEAAATMASHGIRHLPVYDDHHHLVGIVSDRDVRLAAFREPGCPDAAVIFPDAPVSEIMTRSVKVISPGTTVAGAARLMLHLGVGSLVVVSGGRPVGIVSSDDLLRVLASGPGTVTLPPAQLFSPARAAS
jgi:CBS domain-containing protein